MLVTPEQVKLSAFSIEEFERYGLFDEDGCIIGVKEDAPPKFKEAYEYDKKKEAEWEALGLY